MIKAKTSRFSDYYAQKTKKNMKNIEETLREINDEVKTSSFSDFYAQRTKKNLNDIEETL